MLSHIKPIGFLMLGMMGIAFNDVVFKALSGDYSLYQLVFTRSILSLMLLLPLFALQEGLLAIFRTQKPLLHLFRCCLLIIANSLFFSGLAILPLAESSALVFLSPLIVMVLAYFLLGENVGLIRWSMCGAAFLGMVCVIQPFSASFQAAMFLPLSAACAYGSFTITTRFLARTERTSTLAIYPICGFLIASIIAGLLFGSGAYEADAHPSLAFIMRAWHVPPVEDLWYMAVIGLSSAVISSGIAAAYRSGEASLVAPFEYSYLIMALILGYLVWGDFPNQLAFLGIALIFSSGLVMVIREIFKGRQLPLRRLGRGH